MAESVMKYISEFKRERHSIFEGTDYTSLCLTTEA
jgi:hypothetical protein